MVFLIELTTVVLHGRRHLLLIQAIIVLLGREVSVALLIVVVVVAAPATVLLLLSRLFSAVKCVRILVALSVVYSTLLTEHGRLLVNMALLFFVVEFCQGSWVLLAAVLMVVLMVFVTTHS